MTLLGPQIAAWDLLGELQPRTGNRSGHNAPRNVYRTADDALGRGLRERDARSQSGCSGSSVAHDLAEQPWFATGAGRAAHVDEIDAAVAAWIADAHARRGARGLRERRRRARAGLRRERHRSPTRSSLAIGTIASVEDDRLGRSGCRTWSARLSDTPGRDPLAGGAHGADTDAVLGELGLGAEEIAALREQGAA